MNNKLTDMKELGKKPLNIFCDAKKKSDKNYVNSCSSGAKCFSRKYNKFFVVLSLGRILTLD